MLLAVDIVFITQYLTHTLTAYVHLLSYRQANAMERSINVSEPKLHIMLTNTLVSLSEQYSLSVSSVFY